MEDSEKVKFFNNNSLSLEYVVWGEGKKALIAFHGFGRSYHDFAEFTKHLQSEYTIYAVNIFFHGNSSVENRDVDKNPLRPDEFASFFNSFFNSIQAEKVCLMGYSLGGRISFKIAELLPSRIEEMILFAPDGLIVNRWYALLSHYAFGRAIFRYFIKHEKGFYTTLRFLNRTGVISNKLKQFVENETRNKELQWKVYNVWSFLRKTDPNLKKLSKELKKHKIPVRVFIGKHDKIIPYKNTRRLLALYPDLKVFTVDSGHALLSSRVLKELERRNILK